jgi:hypothetical protein
MESFRHRLRTPSPAMIVALIALFVALSGGAAAGTYVAASQLDVRSTSVQQWNAKSLRMAVAHELQRCCRGPRGPRGLRGRRGLIGPEGPQGPDGPTGPAGGFTPANIVYSLNGPIAHMCAYNGGTCAYGESIAHCPAGKVAIGGAWAGDAPDAPSAATVEASFPTYSAGSSVPDGWGVKMVNNDTGTASFHATAVCAG